MKNILVLFFALFAVVPATQAQSQTKYRTDASIRSQFVNNNVPGAVYRDASVKRNKVNATPQKSTSALMRENAMPGMQYKQANSGGKAAAQPEAASGQQLASDKKAEKLPAVKPQEAPQLTQ